jgi:hypothetical protein
MYFEFEFKHIDTVDNGHSLLIVRDITEQLKSQQLLQESDYKSAIESNYSHEQMTPLNIINTSSEYLSSVFAANIEASQRILEQMKDFSLSLFKKHNIQVPREII